MQPIVRLKGVTQIYVTRNQAFLAVEKIHLHLNPGEFVSLVGPSGCGKTTLLSIIAGLISPTEGEVLVHGIPVKKNQTNRSIGYMLQQDYLFPWRTIWENAVIGHELQGKVGKTQTEKTKQLLAEMDLGEYLAAYPHQLSGGMRQRVALVRTLATEPDILLLDEPFSALDYQTKLQLEDLVSTTLRSHEKAALLVTHDISEAIAMSDRVLILDKNPGRLKREIRIPEEIRRILPFEAREHPLFHPIFREVWKEMEEGGGKA